MRKPTYLTACSFLLIAGLAVECRAEKIPYAKSQIQPLTPEWRAKIAGLAPPRVTVDATKRKLLVFSLFTGFKHDVVPYVDCVFGVLGKKSGAFDVTQTVDIEALTPKALAAYDVLVLNNNCSIAPRRNLFLDELERNPKYSGMTASQRQAKADSLQQSILDFVAGGRGLVAIHGAPTMLNNSAKFNEMIGGAFDYHPANQELTLRTVDADHPLVAAFRGKGPFVHRDEPYCFKGCYEKLNFHPLLSMDVKGIKDAKGRVGKIARYVAWIKRYGRGRVFYCSPSHFPESYESSTLLRFLLDGVQYASGDLKCDDSTQKSAKKGSEKAPVKAGRE
ncbi:MAG: ThuA domain-containing protein [Thermoguttaceae bacterium]